MISRRKTRKTTFYFVLFNIIKNLENLKYMGFIIPYNTLLKQYHYNKYSASYCIIIYRRNFCLHIYIRYL